MTLPYKLYYLKPNVIAEPLINNWYASPYLIAPATAAMMFVNSHQKIMTSYITSPLIHEIACRNPETIGGPFIDYPTRRVEEIKSLQAESKIKTKHYFNFVKDIEKLHILLKEHPKGMSLEILYSQLPDSLKGYIELYYDLTNHPHFRFIESLLYHSPLNTDALQSMVFSLSYQDYRPFCLSTPRLASEGDFTIILPFKDKFYDRLFRSKEQPLEKNEMENLFVQSGNYDKKSIFMNLFSTEQQTNSYSSMDKTLTIRYFGHACILIEYESKSILIDPVISYASESDINRFTYSNLPEKIDYVLLTHNHQDHVMMEHLLQLRYKIDTIIVPTNVNGALQDPSLKILLENLGFSKVLSISEFDKIPIKSGFIQGLPFLGEHSDLNIQSKLVYFIDISGTKIACAADSNNLDSNLYEKVHDVVGDIDILFIGMECVGAPLSWLYQPFMLTHYTREMDQSRRLNGSDFNKAKNMVDIFNCKQVYVYAMGQEPWLNYVTTLQYSETSVPIVEANKLVDYCKSKNITSKLLYGSDTISLNPT